MVQKMTTLQRFSDFFEEGKLMHLLGKRVSCTEDQSLISGSTRGGINCAKVAWIGRRHYFKDLRDNGLFCSLSILDNVIYTILFYIYHTRGIKQGS